MESKSTEVKDQIVSTTKAILATIKNDRERQVAEYRFGIVNKDGKKSTLESIGQTLGITRERVRQIEHNLLVKLATTDELDPIVAKIEKTIIRALAEMGRVATVDELGKKLLDDEYTPASGAKIAFVVFVANNLILIEDKKLFYPSVAIAEYGTADDYKSKAVEIAKLISANKKPTTIEELDAKLNYEHPIQIRALASINLKVAHAGERWGLATWPEIKPRTIRDKIALVMRENGKPMHFTEIAEAIEKSNLNTAKRATTAAIHNELIKDKTYVLIGRGIYAMKAWGYSEGRTVADVAISILKQADRPMTKDEITREVLRTRKVQPNTIQVALGNRKSFAFNSKTKTYTPAAK